ncbi:ribosome modulation factor [Novosphingobium sp. M1R2S20]|uniref:Uncharacterized protein n=1 Tax=Novosphingobium rhizovicinum TaxID=3228928 RepID=A0ABV3RBW0_9SPHN
MNQEALLTEANHAHVWGIKAAQAGLSASDNPYPGGEKRTAWLSGYQAGSSFYRGPRYMQEEETRFSTAAQGAAVKLRVQKPQELEET